ncbi:hypothetical protein HHK36_026819 [Tetracentron sinense]|uniref:3-ketoacyl-CoA synthase n=1 Tax=Tetracentron sinense TaxID=13715 RepID=A0A835D2K3_TETSI|nr:hypothetical protein HHK36_026819 [Tetracentron sinense]
MSLFLTPLLALFSGHLSSTAIFCSMLFILLAKFYYMTRRRRVFLVDFACYKPGDAYIGSPEVLMQCAKLLGVFSEESLAFIKKILEKSGIGQSYLPESFWKMPPNTCMAEATKETEMVVFGAIDDLLTKTGVVVKDIGILIVNCSVFNPTPSLAATVVNRYKLRSNILSYNLGGMGCSAGIISIDLAKTLLQVHPNCYALVISTENVTHGWYSGNTRSMLVSNCLFRMGGAAILLSNRVSDHCSSKYELIHTVRTHKGSDDHGYTCAYQEEDDNGRVGVRLSKDLAAAAGDALKTNIVTLAPLVLPVSEQLAFFANLVRRKVLKMKIKPYTPNFKLAFEHFCIHAGGRAILDNIQKNLELTDWHMEPSRMALYKFGNTSSSSLWYELAYSEAKGRIKKGDRLWQIAFGSGFKCNSGIWRALRNIDPAIKGNPWTAEIDKFPVQEP